VTVGLRDAATRAIERPVRDAALNCSAEPLHVLTDRAAGRTPRNIFKRIRYARGNRLCDPARQFLGVRNRKTQRQEPAMDPSCGWAPTLPSLNEIVYFGDGAMPLVAQKTLCPGHIGSARTAPLIPASPCPKTVYL